MRFIKRVLTNLAIFASAVGFATGVQSATYGNATTFTGMVWTMSSTAPGWTSCDRLQLDATADFVNGTGLNMSGGLSCGGGAYGVYGSAYLTVSNTLVMTVNVGVNRVLVCPFNSTLTAVCTVYAADSTQLGTATVWLM
jgi:hypothetical protein